MPQATIWSATRWAASAGTLRIARLIVPGRRPSCAARRSARRSGRRDSGRPSAGRCRTARRCGTRGCGSRGTSSKARPRLPRPTRASGQSRSIPRMCRERGDQLLDPVADAGIAELAEEGQVLADLGVLDRQGRAELAAGDGRLPLPLEGFELPEVEADPAHDGLGGQLLSRGLASRVPHEVGGSRGDAARGKIHAIHRTRLECTAIARGGSRPTRPPQPGRAAASPGAGRRRRSTLTSRPSSRRASAIAATPTPRGRREVVRRRLRGSGRCRRRPRRPARRRGTTRGPGRPLRRAGSSCPRGPARRAAGRSGPGPSPGSARTSQPSGSRASRRSAGARSVTATQTGTSRAVRASRLVEREPAGAVEHDAGGGPRAGRAGGQLGVVGQGGADPDDDRVHPAPELVDQGPRPRPGDPAAVARGRRRSCRRGSSPTWP